MMDNSCEWNQDKAKSNLKKHDVDFHEACSVFRDPIFITVLDKAHSVYEERYITIGLSEKNRLLVIAHTERGDKIRIVNARKATKNERKFYEEAEY